MATKDKILAQAVAKRLFNPHPKKDDSPNARALDIPAKSDTYTFFGNTLKAFESEADEIVLFGAAGTGKSVMWLTKLHRLMRDHPGARGAIIRKTRASLTSTGLVTFEEDVLGGDHPLLLGKGGRRIDRKNRDGYSYPNGSEVMIGGMDNHNRILSGEYDFIFVQEAKELSIEDWEHILTRMRHGKIPYQQLAGDTNPDSPYHWIKQREFTLLKAKHEDNPRFFDQEQKTWTKDGQRYVFGILKKLTGARKKWFFDGEWAISEGAVYDEFDTAIHVIDRFDIPDHWRRFVTIDFGFTNPFVAQWWAVDGDGRMILYREWYMSQRTVRDHASEIHRLNAGIERGDWENMSLADKRAAVRRGERIEAYVADHDAEDRATLHTNEIMPIQTIPAKKAITHGIDLVRERLKVAGDGKPRLMIFRDALVERDEILEEQKLPISTEQEFAAYVYPKGSDGKPKKELPVDKDNHGLDGTRYGAEYLDGEQIGGATRVKVKNWGTRKR